MAIGNATTGDDNITQSLDPDTLIITESNQIGANDFFDGGVGTDTILFGAPIGFEPSLIVNLSPGGVDATHGFHNYEAVSFSSIFTLVDVDAAQFETGLISTSLALTGTNGSGVIFDIYNASNFSAANFTFTTWEQTDNSNNDNHRLEIQGTANADTLTGSLFTDHIYGYGGNDTLVGGGGDDFLQGGRGKDTLIGLNGIDTFDFFSKHDSQKGANRDVIEDFDPNADHIRLTDIDANSTRRGNQAFHLIGPHAFHHKAGELRIKFNDATDTNIVSGDINGDGRADFQIEVHTATALVQADFFL